MSADWDGHSIKPTTVAIADGGAGSRSIYNRTAAVEYAEEWYNSFNSSYYHYRTDCANFVSQCLSAGGIEQTETWHMRKTKKTWWYNPLAWISSNKRYDWDVGTAWSVAPNLYDYFSTCSGNTSIHITSVSEIHSVALSSGVQAGDLLFFANETGIHHAAIITAIDSKMIYYAGHTRPQFDEPLSNGMGSDTVYIVKISD